MKTLEKVGILREGYSCYPCLNLPVWDGHLIAVPVIELCAKSFLRNKKGKNRSMAADVHL